MAKGVGRKRIVSIFLSAIVLMSVCACAPASSSVQEGPQGPLRPADLGTVDFHTEAQQTYLEDSYLFPRARGAEELSRPNVVELTWESDIYNVAYTVRISEQADMSDAKEYTVDRTTLSLYNLKAATTYYWTVTAGETTSEPATFATADCLPRNIYCDGITNMRDVGGWKTEDGRRVKQGLLYRSGQWARSGESTPMITEAGVKTLRELGIVTELDLRDIANDAVEESVVEGINYILRPMIAQAPYYTNNREMVVKVFEVLADESNYPLVIHCAIGTDRTGYVVFLVNALLGVEEESLYRDYLFSNYGNIGSSRAITPVKLDYMNHILEYGDGTVAENCEAFLLDIGVKQEHIDAIRAIMLD